MVEPIKAGEADFVLGSRMILPDSRAVLLPQARYGNQLATFLIRLFYGHRFTDLGPFRAIRYNSLKEIGMIDTNFGWTVEMQVKAVKHGLRIVEIPVRYRKRIGASKITGTVSGTFKAGMKILFIIFSQMLKHTRFIIFLMKTTILLQILLILIMQIYVMIFLVSLYY